MISREKRLHEVFEHLRKFFGIHTQTDFAVALKYSRVYISSALNGNEKNLTDKLFENICEAYPGVFDLHYLLTGDGQLLTIEEEVHNEDHERLYNPQPIDQSSLINAALAAKDETIEDLRQRLREKDMVIQAKDELIDSLRQQITLLNANTDLYKYPFEIGVAESKEAPRANI